MPAYRVIFDRSAFHGDNFARLAGAPIFDLCRRGVIAVYHTPVFIEETLGAYGAQRESNWREHLQFAVKICNGGIFLGKEEIWHEELIVGKGPFARHLMPTLRSRRFGSLTDLKAQLLAAAKTGDLDDIWRETQSERDVSYAKKQNMRRIATEMRAEIASAIRKVRFSGSLSDHPFSVFHRETFEPIGRHLMRVVSKKRTARFEDQWAQNPKRYPYYSAFIDGHVYALYRATFEQGKPIDQNAQADYEQLAYLTWADLIVSNEAKFFRDTFDAVWQSRGKRIESTQGFVELAKKLAG